MLTRERYVILGSLLGLAAAAWALLVYQAQQGGGMSMGLTMGSNAPLFMAMWIAMMVAIMFPTAAPMILTFARIQAGKQQRSQVFVPTWVFVSGYMLLWTVFGVAAYGAALAAEAGAGQSAWIMENSGRIGGAVLVLAGAYQLSPLKEACLSKCRTPLNFIMTSWRDGRSGAFRMGLEHGWYCMGCCWLLFVILFPLGIMNIAAMALITALIFAEKSLPVGPRVAKAAAVVLILYGVVAIVAPGVLVPPMTPEPGAMSM